MRTNGLNRRLTALEGSTEQEDLVKISFQWIRKNLNDGTCTPTSEKIERWVPRNRIKHLTEMFEERDQNEE